jgi:SAM-dependent methyltransferase
VTRCRFCSAPLSVVCADLGMSPIANAILAAEDLTKMEPFYPLRALVCERCFLVQLEDYESPEAIFSDDYSYFSSYSTSWLEHARRYTDAMIERFGVGPGKRVVELASNDGYLLQYFAEAGVDVLGVEPAANVARAAIEKGIPTEVRFFGADTARELAAERHADLLVGNNVLAHVPDLNDFVAGMKLLLARDGVITMEFPHLVRLIEEGQFDTIYHEHFSYFSLLTVREVFAAHGLTIFDVDELPTHGGSLRIYARHDDDEAKPVEPRVDELLGRERDAGYDQLDVYLGFAAKVRETKREVLRFLIDAKRDGKSVVGYGAPAKGNTLLNYCGVGRDFLDFTVDRSPHKQGHFLPGTHIPIEAPERVREERPDYLFILPWNLKDEIVEQMSFVRDWGGRFVVRTPELAVID